MAEQGALYRIELDTKDLKRQAEEVSKTIHGIGVNAEKEGNRIDGVFKKLGAAIAGYFTAQQAISFAQSIVKVRSEIESLEVSFRTLLGSEAKANALFGQIREFAVNTPMMMNDLSKGAQTLLAFNYNADKVMPILKALGDISMGDSNKFNSLTLAFAQMSSAGKLMGQDLMQMINAGFNPLAEISAKTGKSIGQLKDEMSKGAISAQMVEEAFISATSEGGKFYGMLEAQSKTMAGAISNLQGAWEDMLNAIGEESQGVFTDTVSVITKILKNYEEFGKVIVDVIAVFGAYKAAVLLVAAAEKIRYQATLAQMAGMTKMQAVTTVLTEKTELLNKTLFKNPYALVAAAAVTLGIAMYKIISNAGKLSESMQAVEDTSVNLNKEIVKEQLNIDSLFIKLKNAKQGTDEYKDAKKHILDNYGGYLKGLSEELTSLQDIEGAYKAITKAATDSAKARAAASAKENVFNIAAEDSGEVRVKLEKMIRDSYKGQKTDAGRDASTYVWAELEKVLNTGNYDELYKGNLSKLLAKVRKDNINIFGIDKFQKLIEELKHIDVEREVALKKIDVMFGKAAEPETPTETPTNTETEEERKKKWEKQNNIEERLRKIEEYKKKVADAQRDAEFEITQAKIDAMEEGLPKVMAQNELNYQKALADNVDREKAMLEEYRDRMQAEWENANPEFKSKNLHFDRNAITELPADEIQILYNYSDLACQAFEKANKDALEQALVDFETYQQKRARIAEAYDTKKSYMVDTDGNFREGYSQGNVNELELQRERALAAIDEEFAMRSETYEAWCNQIGQMSLQQLEKLLQESKAKLQLLEHSNSADPQQLARARAEVDKLSNAVKKAKANELTPNQQTIQKWQEFGSVIQESTRIIRTLASSFDDATREILECVADVADVTYSMINNIVNLVNTSSEGVVATSTAATTALKTIESASVILAIISAAIQIAQMIANLADPDKYTQKEIDKQQKKYDKIEQQLANRQSRLIDNYRRQLLLVSRGWTEEFEGQLSVTGYTLEELLKGFEYRLANSKIGDQMSMGILTYEARLKKLIKSQEFFNALTDEVTKRLEELSYTADKAYGDARYGDIKTQIEGIAKQIALTYQMMREEQTNKDTDHTKVEEYKQQIKDLEVAAQEYLTSIMDDIMGGSADAIAERLGNAFIEAFAAGEDAAQAWANEVNNIIADIMKRMLIQKFVEERIGQVFDSLQKTWLADGGIDTQEVIDSMDYLQSELNQIGSDFSTIFDTLPEDVKNMLTSSADLKGTAGQGITTASQESVDELNGRVTAIQGHTYELANNSRVLTANTTDILRSVRNIEDFASDIKQKVVDIEIETRDMKRALNDFEIHGINIK